MENAELKAFIEKSLPEFEGMLAAVEKYESGFENVIVGENFVVHDGIGYVGRGIDGSVKLRNKLPNAAMFSKGSAERVAKNVVDRDGKPAGVPMNFREAIASEKSALKMGIDTMRKALEKMEAAVVA